MRDPTIASISVRMMMAVNDAALANTALAEWSATTDRRRLSRAQGAKMYFSRLQMGHALEALKIVKEIEASTLLLRAVDACDSHTRASFNALRALVVSADYKTLEAIRNNLSFHYSPKLVARALKRIETAHPDDTSLFTLGTEALQWHFELADKVVDSIMVRDLLVVPATEAAQPATDAAIARLWEMQVTFADFAAYFTRHYAANI